MSVNRPTNVKQKEQDINQKLQLYGIYSAFANGKAPSNKQIDVALNSALNSKALSRPSTKLSQEGRELVGDLRDVIEKAKVLLLTKNEGNLIQDFIWQSQLAGTGNASKPGAPIDKNTAKQHGNQALDGMKTLGTLIISNGQFRKLLNDGLVLLRDIAGDGAQKAASKVNPSDDALENIDEPEEDNTWHEVPDIKGQAKNISSQAKDKFQQAKPTDKQGFKDAARDAQSSGENSGSNRDGAKNALKSGMNNLKGQANDNVPDDQQDEANNQKEKAKDKARQARDKSKGYLKEKMPEERREQVIYRLKKMIVEIQGHSDYQNAIDTLLGLAEEYTGHTKTLTKSTAGAAKDVHADDSLTNAETDLKILIERFANYTSMDDLFDGINAIYGDAARDPELKGWFKHMDVYIRKCLKEEGYVLKDSSTDEWNKLYDQGEFLLRDRYRNHTQRLIDEVQHLTDQMASDPMNKAFGDSLQKLFYDLGNDEDGKPTFKPHLLKDLANVIVPGIFESISYVPIPRIEYSDPMADAIIENLVIESDNLAPNMFEFGTDNYFRWGRKTVASRNKNKVMVSASGIQMDLKDVSYYIKKKEGFPSITDTGLMDIFLGGSGFSFKAALETADKSDDKHFFKVNTVVVDIKHMNIKLKKSKYKTLFAIVKPLLLKVMLPILTKVIEKVIKDQVHKLDAFLYGINLEAQKALKQAKNDPDSVGNIYQRYYNAFTTKLESGKQKSKEKSADKEVNIAMTKHDSMFPNVSLPGGVSTKATEYKDLAAKGQAWESPIFSIGSARETSSSELPQVQKIKRKEHDTAPSEIRGTQNIGQSTEEGYSHADSSVFAEKDKYGSTLDNAQSSNQYDGQDRGQSGYGYAQGSGYGAQEDNYAQDSYGQGQGYGQGSYGQTNGNAYGYGSTGATTGTSTYKDDGYGAPQDAYSSTAAGGTTLGQYNPVLQGRI